MHRLHVYLLYRNLRTCFICVCNPWGILEEIGPFMMDVGVGESFVCIWECIFDKER